MTIKYNFSSECVMNRIILMLWLIKKYGLCVFSSKRNVCSSIAKLNKY